MTYLTVQQYKVPNSIPACGLGDHERLRTCVLVFLTTDLREKSVEMSLQNRNETAHYL